VPTICNANGICTGDGDSLGQALDSRVTTSFEIIVPDGSPEEICQSLYLQFQAAVEGGSVCEDVLDCNITVAAGDPCHCALYASDASVSGFLATLEAEYVAQGCAKDEKCSPCPWIEVPVCNHGVCAPSQPSCQEIEGQYVQALLLAQQCTEDEQCSGRAAGALDCDCEVPVNGEAWTGYFDLAAELWKTSDCGVQLDCSCVALLEVACLGGVCGAVE